MGFLDSNCTFQVLNKSLITFCEPFSCSEKDLNEFFFKDCVAYSEDLFGKTYCFTLDENPRVIVCAFTISNDSIKAKLLPKVSQNKLNRKISNQKRSLKSYPAVLIGRLGVNNKFEGKGLGQELLDFVKAWFIDEENKTGCRFLVVDSYNKERPISFYVKNGFKFMFSSEVEEKDYSGIISEQQLNTRLMYFDLIQLSSSK